MRIGDKVELAYPFKITDIQKYSLIISVQSPNGPDHLFIPKYLNGFGLRLPGYNFTYPGELIDVEHADYYKRVGSLDGGKQAIYENRYNKRVRLVLDPKVFHLTGEYTVLNMDNGGSVIKYARQKSDAQIEDELRHWAEQDSISGSTITGIVTDIRYNRAYGTDPEVDEVRSAMTLEHALASHAADNNNFPHVTITARDELTLIEFSLPHHILKVMI